MKPIEFFTLPDCPLPAVAIEKGTPAELAQSYGRLKELLAPVEAERGKARAAINDILSRLLKRFDAEALDALRAVRYRLLVSMQAEIDIRDEFEGWLASYSGALLKLHEEANRARDTRAAEIRERVLAAGAFDEVVKAHPAQADALVKLHPDVRKANDQIARMDAAHKPILDPVSFDAETAGDAVWVAPSSVNQERRSKLAEMIHAELGHIIRAEGLLATVQYGDLRTVQAGAPDSGASELLRIAGQELTSEEDAAPGSGLR